MIVWFSDEIVVVWIGKVFCLADYILSIIIKSVCVCVCESLDFVILHFHFIESDWHPTA